MISRERSIDECLHWLPSILRKSELSEWERDFARSILAQSKRRKWKPSPKQIQIMRGLVDDMFAPADLVEG